MYTVLHGIYTVSRDSRTSKADSKHLNGIQYTMSPRRRNNISFRGEETRLLALQDSAWYLGSGQNLPSKLALWQATHTRLPIHLKSLTPELRNC
jgi:hypothetical protein